MNDAVFAAQTANLSDTAVVIDEDLREAMERTLQAGRALLAHWRLCEARRVNQISIEAKRNRPHLFSGTSLAQAIR